VLARRGVTVFVLHLALRVVGINNKVKRIIIIGSFPTLAVRWVKVITIA
jgi:hypothetical protein